MDKNFYTSRSTYSELSTSMQRGNHSIENIKGWKKCFLDNLKSIKHICHKTLIYALINLKHYKREQKKTSFGWKTDMYCILCIAHQSRLFKIFLSQKSFCRQEHIRNSTMHTRFLKLNNSVQQCSLFWS